MFLQDPAGSSRRNLRTGELKFDDTFKDVIPKLDGAFQDSKSRLEMAQQIKTKMKELNEKNQFKDRYETKVEAKNGCENIDLNDLNELIRFKQEEASKNYMKILF